MSVVRWLLVVALVAIGMAIGIFAILLLQEAVMWFCPAALVISGLCTASWYPAVEELAMCLGAAIGAAAVVGLPSLAAPRRRHLVAIAAFCSGTAFAATLAFTGGPLWFPFASAIASGAMVLWLFMVGARGKNAA
jgi:hypothetical protein